MDILFDPENDTYINNWPEINQYFQDIFLVTVFDLSFYSMYHCILSEIKDEEI